MTSDIKPDTQLPTRTTTNVQPPRGDGASPTPLRFGIAIGASPSMQALFASLERVAPTDSPVLLEGEQGTGKRTLGRALHEASARGSAPFVVLDGELPPSALEAELFGSERGPNGGIKKGALEGAEGGTLLLREVCALPLELQTKLVRALESKEYRRVGGTRALPFDARLVATSTLDLRRQVERGQFNVDLLLRLGTAPLVVPPLRERREDIRALAAQFLRRISDGDAQDRPFTLSDDAAAALCGHDWPGNAEELAQLLARAIESARLTGEREIRFVGLPAGPDRPADPYVFQPGRTYRETRARFETEFERRYVKWLLGRHHGNISAAAREVQMDRKYLYDLAKKHGMRGKEEQVSSS